jgi:small subunit ribosomal protein S4
MARDTTPVCRLCRREGEKLYLKGSRCETAKCAIVRRNFQPGVHPWSRGKPSDYGIRLREKQKVKRFYGVHDRQFERYFRLAQLMPGNTGESLLVLLERRLDNVVFLLGLSPSRRAARQLVAHGHINVNGHRCDSPAALVEIGDTVTVRPKEKIQKLTKASLEDRKGRTLPPWLTFDEAQSAGRVVDTPKREQVEMPIEEQLIVELMSK